LDWVGFGVKVGFGLSIGLVEFGWVGLVWLGSVRIDWSVGRSVGW